MKAAVFIEPGRIVLQDKAIPDVAPLDALIRITTTTICGTDMHIETPKAGVFVGPNLTPDKETGLGTWTREQIIAALQKGERPDGRKLSPIMPWPAFSKLTNEDAGAIADYLMSLPAVNNKTPGPFGPYEKPPIAVRAPSRVSSTNISSTASGRFAPSV